MLYSLCRLGTSRLIRLLSLLIFLGIPILAPVSSALQQVKPPSHPTQPPQASLSARQSRAIMSQPPPPSTAVSFSHVHLYVDKLEDLSVYKDLENKLNQFSNTVHHRPDDDDDDHRHRRRRHDCITMEEQRQVWQAIAGDTACDKDNYVPQNRDVVKQLLSSFGFRVTGERYPSNDTSSNTRSVLVTSRDPCGVQIVVTALDNEKNNKEGGHDTIRLFDASKVQQFFACHKGFQGIAVLAFMVQNVRGIKENYEKLHPELIVDYDEYGNTKILEVYAYYQYHEKEYKERVADKGTVLRFVQNDDSSSSSSSSSMGQEEMSKPFLLPGLAPVEATFEDNASAAYCDHWVSNVFSRTEFLDTLQDTLGFTPKVDFNAGVVAAGEAQIESTVTGNESVLATADKKIALKDQSQVYLPINNALSSVGHVHGFLQELGQGVQHVASRVENLVSFVQRGNDYRKITNEGFTFLRIPRSYYGVLSLDMLTEGIVGDGTDAVTEDCAQDLMEGLVRRGTLTKEGSLDLDLSREQVDNIVEETLTGASFEEYKERKDSVLNILMRSRYKNLYALLRENVSESTYLGIVRNQILVDIQGEDLLYQIFTSNILQRKAGEEAPFFEFIQRVCSECIDESTGCPQKIRPGCGGFGIRNFLTLFLSIEVSKAMQEVTDALLAGDVARQDYAQAMVDCFTEQLNESNPILTQISDAMTLEGQLKEELSQAMLDQDHDAIALVERRMTDAAELKVQGNKALMECSLRYNDRMKALREQREAKQK